MSILLGDNFQYQAGKPLDGRLKYATLAEMKAVADATMYDGCMAYCVETDKTYQWKLANTVDADTGRWREFSSGGSGGTTDYEDLDNKPSINDIELDGNKTSEDLNLASKEDMDKAYKSDDTAFTDIADGDYVPVYDVSETAKKKSLWSNIKDKLKAYFDTLYDLNKSDIPMYATSSTGASTTAKTATVSRGTFTLVAGAKVSVKFTYGNTASAPTLNIGSTGAKNIKYIDSDGTVTTPTTWWGTREVVTFVYDGTQWLMMPTISMIPSLPVVGTMSKSDLYSTTEKVVGMWTDGRPIYQRTFTGTLGTSDLLVLLNGSYTLINAEGRVYYSSSNFISINWADANDANSNCGIYQEDNTISLLYGASYKNQKYYITLRYTKTTDSANSYNYSSENEYSTSEKIVGTWIDGSLLYQKTIAITLPTATTAGTPVNGDFAIGVSVKNCVYLSGWFNYEGRILFFNEINSSSGSIYFARCLVLTNSYDGTSADRNKIRIQNASPAWSGSTGYVTIQYTKT